MSRIAVPLEVTDLSPFAKTLRQSLSAHDGVPSHVELLNMLARSAGFANYQHLRADTEAADRLRAAAEPLPRPELGQVEKAARFFGTDGRLGSWPSRFGLQLLCLWVLWSRIPAGASYTERQFSALLNTWHGFGDAALIRRTMFEARMIDRTREGRDYRRIEQPPPAKLAPLLAHLESRTAPPVAG